GPISRRRAQGRMALDDTPPEQIPPQPSRPRPPRRRRRRRGLPLLPLLILLLVGAGAYFALPYAGTVLAGDRVMTGVSLQGDSLGGLDRAQLDARVQQRYAAFLSHPLTISFEGRTWTPTLEELGAHLSLEQVAEEALAA